MGACPCFGPKDNDDPVQPDDSEDEKKYKKLLLLGAGWSGKSTVFKQMKVKYGSGFSDEERRSLRWTVYQNVLQAMKTLCEENKDNPYGVNDPKLKEDYQYVLNYEDKGDNIHLDADLGTKIKNLWADPAIKATYNHRTEFFFANDEVHYFFKKIDEIMKDDYVPDEDDVLRCRWISTGVKRETFKIDGKWCELLDVGGQRSERKKWVKCFENVYIVLFVVAISEYDQVMYEDEDSNRVIDALDLFEDICNSKWFASTNVVLFLNKVDLFNQKIKTVPLENYFANYKPDPDRDLAQQGREFLKKEFEKRNHQERPVIVTTTCATEKDDLARIFDETIKNIVSTN